MADLNNQQFYEVDPEGSQTPSPKQLIKVPLLIGGAVIIIVIAIIAIVSFLRPSDVEVQDQLEAERIEQVMTNGLSDCEGENNVDLCKNRLSTQMATEHGDASLCQSLEGQWLVNCVELIAADRLDANFCSVLEEAAAARCQDRVAYLQAVEANDKALCDGIKLDFMKETCLAGFFSLETCVEQGFDPTACQNAIELDGVLKSGDLSACGNFEDEVDKNNCQAVFRAQDRDFDGLSDYEEIIKYGTDPSNADTDGDGFRDGDEVANGFDPLN